MEDIGNGPHSMGNGQAHTVNHTRPFFYVQPPSQPYCMYQWQMNNPFNHYSMSGSAFPFGRPYLAPYPYAHCPGYMVPHAPMQPVDYRRVFNPHFSPTYDIRIRHHHQARMRRETACSEVQTEPSDLVNELIESFSRLRGFKVASEVERELDSGVVSQASGMCLDSEHGEKVECRSIEPEPLPQRQKAPRYASSVAAALLVEPINAAYDVDSSQSPLEDLPHQDGWNVSAEEVLPLDSSSLHEMAEDDEELGDACVPEELHLADQASAKAQTAGGRKACTDHQWGDAGHCDVASMQGTLPAQMASPRQPITCSGMAPDGMKQVGQKASKRSSLAHTAKGKGFHEKTVVDVEAVPYQILRLPCDKVAATSLLQKSSPLWCVDSALMPPSSYLSSLGNALYYSYYPQTAQERQSILSPSLDELSSRDELFSTDLEDLDLMPGHVYMGSRGVSHNARETLPSAGEEVVPAAIYRDACPVCPTMCSVCGMRLTKEGPMRAGPGSCDYSERGGSEDTAEDEDDSLGLLKHSSKAQKAAASKRQRHLQPPAQKALKLRDKRRYHDYVSELDDAASQEQGYLGEPECCEEHRAIATSKRTRDQQPKGAQYRLCSEKPTRRRTPYKTTEHQRSKRDDHEFPLCRKGRESAKRSGTRC